MGSTLSSGVAIANTHNLDDETDSLHLRSLTYKLDANATAVDANAVLRYNA